MIVMKFGGASLSTSEGISKACRIIKTYWREEKIILVVSAMKGITDKLFLVSEYLKKNNIKEALKLIEDIKRSHIKALYEFDFRPQAVKTESEIINLISRLTNFINNISQKRITPARVDFIVSFGERLSCPIVANALEMNGMSAHPIDASYIMATNNDFGNAIPLYKKSQHHINEILIPLINNNIIPVVTGYIGFTHDGCSTTLGRGGSDLSAAYLANLLGAKALYLWKDVKGFYDIDPNKNKNAKKFTKLSYNKAKALAKKGAKIIYYKAIEPVKNKNIPIYIKSFIDPEEVGTIVGK